jgi:hypothetical protein
VPQETDAGKVARLEHEIEQLKQEMERLRRALDEALRAAKRRAAPFSRRGPKAIDSCINTDTSIDKPVKQPVPKPKTGRFPKRGPNGQFLPGAVGNPKGRPRGSRNRASVLMEDSLDGRAKGLDDVGQTLNGTLLDAENLGRDRANSDYVRRHLINSNFTWELPFGRGNAIRQRRAQHHNRSRQEHLERQLGQDLPDQRKQTDSPSPGRVQSAESP